MELASVYFLGVTFLMFVIFAAIVARTLSKKQRIQGEAPKYKMMDED